MKLIFPNNVFAALFILSLDETYRDSVRITDSSLIVNELLQTKDAVALIPSLDLMKQRDLKISSKFGIGFEGLLSNSYLYFKEDDNIDQIYLKGDISSNDVILSKILFQERYGMKPEIILDSNNQYNDKTCIISGNGNWEKDNFKKGTSLSEQINDLTEFPYINYIFASKEESTLKDFHSAVSGINEKIIKNFNKNLEAIGLDENVNSFIESQMNSINFFFREYEITSLKELYQTVYYYGILDDLFDIKFVS